MDQGGDVGLASGCSTPQALQADPFSVLGNNPARPVRTVGLPEARCALPGADGQAHCCASRAAYAATTHPCAARARLPGLAQVSLLDKMPTTGSGKILKTELRRMLGPQPAAAAAGSPAGPASSPPPAPNTSEAAASGATQLLQPQAAWPQLVRRTVQALVAAAGFAPPCVPGGARAATRVLALQAADTTAAVVTRALGSGAPALLVASQGRPSEAQWRAIQAAAQAAPGCQVQVVAVDAAACAADPRVLRYALLQALQEQGMPPLAAADVAAAAAPRAADSGLGLGTTPELLAALQRALPGLPIAVRSLAAGGRLHAATTHVLVPGLHAGAAEGAVETATVMGARALLLALPGAARPSDATWQAVRRAAARTPGADVRAVVLPSREAAAADPRVLSYALLSSGQGLRRLSGAVLVPEGDVPAAAAAVAAARGPAYAPSRAQVRAQAVLPTPAPAQEQQRGPDLPGVVAAAVAAVLGSVEPLPPSAPLMAQVGHWGGCMSIG